MDIVGSGRWQCSADAIIITGLGRSVQTLGAQRRGALLAVLPTAVVSVVQWPTVARCKVAGGSGGCGILCLIPVGGSGGNTASFPNINNCGNGLIDIGEYCDDGNTLNGDGCTGCIIDPGCSALCLDRPACRPLLA